jgi:8-hydroxy-5-deazaflavin:NADPH oxidoreductase
MKIAFIGCGQVGGALADQFQRRGYEATLATRDEKSENVRRACKLKTRPVVKVPSEAVRWAEVIFIATPY